MKLQEHIDILNKVFKVIGKRNLMRMLWTIYEEHHKEIKNIEDLISQIGVHEKAPVQEVK